MEILFFVSILFISIELFFSGTIIGFFQKRIKTVDLFKFFIPVCIIELLLLVGLYSGAGGAKIFEEYKVWYSGTILFILSMKLMYDGIKLNKLKKSINPLDLKGLLYVSVLISINAFFIGLAFGLLGSDFREGVFSAFLFYAAILIGYFVGFRLKHLINFRNDLFFAAIFLIIAIVIALKF